MISLQPASSKLLFATARIDAECNDRSQSIGTAFFFHFTRDEQRILPVLVTNKHVVASCNTGCFWVHRSTVGADGQPAPSGGHFQVSLAGFANVWVPHPDADVDLCAMPFQPLRQAAREGGKEVFYIPLEERLVAGGDVLQELAALEEVVMVGYPVGLWDDRNNMPILRRGITATHPAQDFRGRPLGIVDIGCFPGSSGSPVLVLNEGAFATPRGMTLGTRVILLGVLASGPVFSAEGTIRITDIPTSAQPMTITDIPVHLGLYVKARELLVLKEHMISVLESGTNDGPTGA